MSHHHLIKRCRVCGDQATSFNFGGVCCEACKSFFRRNALRAELSFNDFSATCPTGGQCTVNLINRRKCGYCRLQKCYRVGLKNELLLQSEQHQHHLVETPSRSLQLNTNLQAYERLQLEQVQYAFSAFIDESALEVAGQFQSAQQILNHPCLYIVPTITFCKRLPTFKALPPEDQLILFKNFFPEMDSVRVSYRYDHSVDGWTGIEDESGQRAVLVKMEALRRWRRVHEMIAVFESFVQALSEQLEGDVVIRNLVLVSLLFKPRPALSSAEPVLYEHYQKCYLLSRYLEAKYSSRREASRKYHRLRLLLTRAEYIGAIIGRCYQQMATGGGESTVAVDGPLREVYDLL